MARHDPVPEPTVDPEMARHTGSLISGRITCSCKEYETDHWAFAGDAEEQFEREHLDKVEPGWRDRP